MSSLEFNRTIQMQSSSRNQTRIPENTNSKVAKKQSLHFHHIVKDSMHKEAQGLSVKTVAEEEKKGQTNNLKLVDSPRPLRSHKSVNGVNGGVTVASEPFHTLAKSKKTPSESPRFSYDETFKSATKHKEFPRLSLDSRERSNRGSNEGNKSRNLLKGQQKGYAKNSSTMINQLQEPETSKRSSSVVAKLMGLEALPERTQTCGSSIGTSSCSSTSDEDKHQQKLTLPQFRKADSTTNEKPYSRFALESIPWRQPDAIQSSPLQKSCQSDIKASKTSLTVYGEIEKRVAELEFKKSGKDLRALKHILEAMQRRKDSLDIASDQASNSPSSSSPSDNRNSTNSNESSNLQSPRVPQKNLASVTVEMSNSTQGSKLPIVIMKPAKVTKKVNSPSPTELSVHGKSGLSKCSPSIPTNGRLVHKHCAKGISPTKNIKDPFGQQVRPSHKNMRTSKLMQSLKASHDSTGECTTNSGYITVTGSPRLQKKFGLERSSQPTSSSSDSYINRREHNRQHVELSSLSTTPRHKFSTLQQINERFNEISSNWRDSKHHVNVISDFDDKSSCAGHSEIEVVRIDQTGKIISSSMQLSCMNQNVSISSLHSNIVQLYQFVKHSFVDQNAFEELRKADAMVTAEQPSPVSVLDAAFYRDDPPSPVKKKPDISKYLGKQQRLNQGKSKTIYQFQVTCISTYREEFCLTFWFTSNFLL